MYGVYAYKHAKGCRHGVIDGMLAFLVKVKYLPVAVIARYGV